MTNDCPTITFEFACRDDCLDLMTPGHLRELVAERDALLSRLEKAENEVVRLREEYMKIVGMRTAEFKLRVDEDYKKVKSLFPALDAKEEK